jgi:beta-phosphoglucomutase
MAGNFVHEKTWGVIFDMDGVLIDSYRAHFFAWRQILRNHGLDMTDEQFGAIFGRTNPDILAQLYPSLKPDDYFMVIEEKEAAFREMITVDFPEMDGATQLIAALYEAGAALAIGSSGPPENVQAVLNMLPGGEHFTVVTDGNEISRGKPNPEVFVKTVHKLCLPPAKCVVVEDAPAGVMAGKAAGCPVIALTGTALREQLSQADIIVHSLWELTPELFKRLIGSTSRNHG